MRGIFYLIISGFFLGMTGLWAKLIGTNISPFLLTIVRTLLSTCLIILLIILSKGIKTIENLVLSKKDIPLLFLAGFFGVSIGFGFYIKSLSLIPVANAVALVYVYPVFTTLLSFFFLREKITKLEIVAVFLVILGIWSIYGSEINIASSTFGNILALVAGIGYSVFIVAIRLFEAKGMPYWKVTFWPFLIGGLMVSLLLPFEQFAFSPSGLVSLFVLGLVISSFLGYVFYAKGLRTTKAHDAVIITSMTEPLSAIILAFFILEEPIPRYVFLGVLLIIMSNILVGIEYKKKMIHIMKTKKQRV